MSKIRDQKSVDVEKTKIIFQFSLMLIASVIAGICFSKLLSADTVDLLTAKVVNHFEATLSDDSMLADFMSEFFRLSVADLVCVLILFVFSFSFVNYLVSDLVLIFIGFRFGINSAIIKLATVSMIGVGDSISFWLLKGIMLPIFLAFACRMALYSLQLRRFSPNNARMILNKSATSSLIIHTLTMIGTAMIFNGLYCLFLYVF